MLAGEGGQVKDAQAFPQTHLLRRHTNDAGFEWEFLPVHLRGDHAADSVEAPSLAVCSSRDAHVPFPIWASSRCRCLAQRCHRPVAVAVRDVVKEA
jgi:hypothetical protein